MRIRCGWYAWGRIRNSDSEDRRDGAGGCRGFYNWPAAAIAARDRRARRGGEPAIDLSDAEADNPNRPVPAWSRPRRRARLQALPSTPAARRWFTARLCRSSSRSSRAPPTMGGRWSAPYGSVRTGPRSSAVGRGPASARSSGSGCSRRGTAGAVAHRAQAAASPGTRT